MGSFQMTILVLMVLAAYCFDVTSGGKMQKCLQGVNCHLPSCFCPTFKHPLGARKIPQIVYFGFDDAVTSELGKFYTSLFTADRKNPNNCSITMSLYINNEYTNYTLVDQLYKANHEIADHSVTHGHITTKAQLEKEAEQQRINLARSHKIPPQSIIGYRSPFLQTAGSDQPEVLKKLNFTYDISLPYDSLEKVPFPYTLDYGYPYSCSVRPCPGKHTSVPGFWEVPINQLALQVDNNKGQDGYIVPCSYVDGCRPKDKVDAYDFLMANFLRTYNAEKAPFGLNMHPAWFLVKKWDYLEAMEQFILTLLRDYPDVYIVSVKQMLDWMRTPTDIEGCKTFKPWGCPAH